MQLFASKVDEDGKLLNGVRGVQAPFSVDEMRPHLVACLEEQCLAPFPRRKQAPW